MTRAYGGQVVLRRRLIRELEAVTARTVLLVAPPGYGKTIAASQWIDHAGGAAVNITEASLDIPVLARDISSAIASMSSLDVRRLEAVLAIGRPPLEQADYVCRAILSEVPYPVDGWLIIDDYHRLARSRAAEMLVANLEQSGRFRMMIASRDRPLWATARRFVHLELVEFGSPDLAFDDEETNLLLGANVPDASFRERARGWPAVIALAAYAQLGKTAGSLREWTDSLYDYFAEEIFETTSPAIKHLLVFMSLLPSLAVDEVMDAVSPFAPLVQAVSTGFIKLSRDNVDLHPLAREFLLSKVRSRKDAGELATKAFELSIDKQQWDNCFWLTREFSTYCSIDALIRSSFTALVETGRLATLDGFARYAAATSTMSQPILDLIAGEVALRDGAYDRARALSQSAVDALADGDPLRARGLIVAGEAARLAYRFTDALDLHSRAGRVAIRPRDVSAAAWGKCLAAISLETANAVDLVHEFEVVCDTGPEERLRVMTARYIIARLGKGFSELGIDLTCASELVKVCPDPRVRAGWLNAHGYALMLQGRYGAARDVLRDGLREIDDAGLTFARPHVEGSLAFAELGLRQLTRCASLIRRVENAATRAGDRHMLVNAAILRSRLYLAQQRPKEAYDAVAEDFDNFPTQAMHGEYLASRALALAISGEDDRAVATISDARGLTMAVETQVIAACVDALAARDGPQGKRANAAMLATASALETWDGVVVALRAGGEWASEVMSESKYRNRLEGVLALANDYSLARKFGLRVRPITPNGGLSQRELEVLDLIRSGLKNKEIAAALFIGPSTVKTHVDSILAKLGASTRAEAVALYAEATVDMTGDPTHHPPGGRASGRTSS